MILSVLLKVHYEPSWSFAYREPENFVYGALCSSFFMSACTKALQLYKAGRDKDSLFHLHLAHYAKPMILRTMVTK